MLTDGWPFALSARDSVASGSRMILFQANHSDSPRFTALSGVEGQVALPPSSQRCSTVVRIFAAECAANKPSIHRP